MLQSTTQFPIAFPLRAAASGTSNCPIDVVYREVLGTKWRGSRALVVSLSNHTRRGAAFFVSFGKLKSFHKTGTCAALSAYYIRGAAFLLGGDVPK